MKKKIMYALIISIIIFATESLKRITLYPFIYKNSLNNYFVAGDVFITTIFGFFIALFFIWALDLNKKS
ncbi:hypothetical protein DVZ64_11685 [Staphylococcus pseudintermedius]|nr:hypothetical protein [Staphylococcus pseudintermedius]